MRPSGVWLRTSRNLAFRVLTFGAPATSTSGVALRAPAVSDFLARVALEWRWATPTSQRNDPLMNLNVLLLEPPPEFHRQYLYFFVGLGLAVVAFFVISFVFLFAIHTNRPILALRSVVFAVG